MKFNLLFLPNSRMRWLFLLTDEDIESQIKSLPKVTWLAIGKAWM